MQPSATAPAYVDTCLLLQDRGEFGPKLSSANRPMHVIGMPQPLSLQPDEAEISAGGAVGNIAFIQQGNPRALTRSSPGECRANQTAADDNEVVTGRHAA